jgi:2,3-bisphosphoglycerate-independent phosphoglycerate mutase
MTTLLLILDGWGLAKPSLENAIHLAKTPNWDSLIQNSPTTKLIASGTKVGLPARQAGNSEVGHLHIGAGNIILQDLARINKELENIDKTKIKSIVETTKKNQATLHLVGLLSPGGVHSHEEQLFKILEYLDQHECSSALHIILDGRDTDPKAAKKSLLKLRNYQKNCQIASISGRYYAMDRDQRWERTKLAYDAMTKPLNFTDNIFKLLDDSYKDNITDEFIQPTAMINAPRISSNDSLLCFNFRADRAHQIMQAFGETGFNKFSTNIEPISNIYSLTDYPLGPKQTIAIFPAQKQTTCLGKVLAQNNLSQLRIAETEKYAHVTFFLDGGELLNLTKMKKIVIPSPKVATYDLSPKMSCEAIAQNIIDNLNRHDVIIANFANADMVGHTGMLEPTIEAIESIDISLGKIIAALGENDEMLITADHGNAEAMGDKSNPKTSHSVNPVPLIYYGSKQLKLQPGSLANITPTLLEIMQIKQPKDMLANSLIIK